MAETSRIEWTDTSWNVVTGCSRVSSGCQRCYAEVFLRRWAGVAGHPFATGFVPTIHPGRLGEPLRWPRPRRVFVAALGDLFHDAVPDAFIAEVFAVMLAAHWHTFQVLTKRHARMRALLSQGRFAELVFQLATDRYPADARLRRWPLPNVWLGVSAETQRWADLRIPALLDTPAALRWVSCEPLLGPVDLSRWFKRVQHACDRCHVPGPLDWHSAHLWGTCPCLCHPTPPVRPDWVVVGGESGPGARPLDPAWVRQLVDLGDVAQVPVFVKQLGTAFARTQGQRGRGADPDQWPPALRVRAFPTPTTAPALSTQEER